MSKGVLIDSCTLGVLSHINASVSDECRDWAVDLRRKGTRILIPEIAVYEHRRQILLIGNPKSVRRFEETVVTFGVLPLSTAALDLAAAMWAKHRRGQGKDTTSDQRLGLDADIMICAQAKTWAAEDGLQVTVATDNVRHFTPHVDGERLVAAKPWNEIAP